ncbi:MAG: hypothetical protein ACK5EA_19405 [Planctomycetaceae bacterium]
MKTLGLMALAIALLGAGWWGMQRFQAPQGLPGSEMPAEITSL